MIKKVFVTVEVIEYPGPSDFSTGYPNINPRKVVRKRISKMFCDDRCDTISDKNKAIMTLADMTFNLALMTELEGSDDE